MLHIVNPDPEAVMANKKTADDTRRVFKKHRQLRPEEAVCQIAGAGFQRQIKFVEVKIV